MHGDDPPEKAAHVEVQRGDDQDDETEGGTNRLEYRARPRDTHTPCTMPSPSSG